MRFTSAILSLAAVSAVAALPAQAENASIQKARALYKRHFPEAQTDSKLRKRNNGGSGLTDTDILNFALQLEYLEAQFYHIAAYGTQLSQDLLSGTGKRGYVKDNAGNQVPFTTDLTRQYAVEIAQDEMHHVAALRAALGKDAVAMPELNLKESFSAAATAAGIIKSGESFDPFSSDANFLLGAFLFEDVGVTAYNGAAPLLSSKAALAAAAGILAVEAYHAASIRTNLLYLGQDTPALISAANAAAAAEGSLGGGKSEGITKDGKVNIVPADENSIAYARSVSEVVNIVTLGGGKVGYGGFFPNGLN